MGSEVDRLRYEQDEWNRQLLKDRRVLEADAREANMPLTVALVGCGKKKRDVRCKAHEMYTGSLFRLSFGLAMRTADDVQILSALHGLLAPFDEIDSYQLGINQLLLSEQDEWGRNVVADLTAAYPMMPLRIIVYAGQAYVRPIMKAAGYQEGYWEFRNPLKGLDLFERLRWLRAQQTD